MNQPNHRPITDAGVGRLPITQGRAELLEEIMAQSTLGTGSDHDTQQRRWTKWALPAAAAAAVAALIVVPQLVGDDAPKTKIDNLPVATAPGSGRIAVLEAAGWTMDDASVDKRGGELTYESGDDELDISWRLADTYADYVADRDDIGPSASIDVLGRSAQMWAYDRTDHTMIRVVEGDFYLEVRGSGMPKAAYLELLGDLKAIAPADLDAYLPDAFITAGERSAAIADMLADIPVPDGFDADIKSEEIDPYQLGADVTGAVTCAWLKVYDEGDAAARTEAEQALIGARDWAVLKTMTADGDWPDAIWEIGDRLKRGKSLEGVGDAAIGCES